MRRKYLTVCAIILTAILSTSAQTPDQTPIRHPTEEELAANKRLQELLRHPTFNTLRLVSAPRDVPREAPTDTPAPYKVKDYIGFELFVTQNSSEKITIWSSVDPYDQCRPELTKDGEILPYNKRAQKEVESDRPPSGSGAPITFEPGREYGPQRIGLDDWYETLTPGRYRLTVRKRFTWDGDWAVSNPVYFEVVPRASVTPIPSSVSIELLPEGLQPKKDGGYELGTEVYIRVFVVNNSDHPVKVSVVDLYYSVRPQLFKDGSLVPYREETAKLIVSKVEKPSLVHTANDFFLDPGTKTGMVYIKLRDWYESLSPGSYRLVTPQRFEIDGPWTADS